MKTTELIELLKTHDVTANQLYTLLTEDLNDATRTASGSLEDEMPQQVLRFFVYQIQSVMFPVISDLRTLNKQLHRGGEVFKAELDSQDK
jgi:hypothetical protein